MSNVNIFLAFQAVLYSIMLTFLLFIYPKSNLVTVIFIMTLEYSLSVLLFFSKYALTLLERLAIILRYQKLYCMYLFLMHTYRWSTGRRDLILLNETEQS